MRILLMGQHFSPEDVSGAVLATELATDLVRRGHEVSFVTSAPNYPHGRVFHGYRNAIYHTEVLDGVRVSRVWSFLSPRKTFWRRIADYATFSCSAFYGGLLAGKPDVLMSASPPLPLGLSAWLLSRLWGVPWVLRVEDLYPEAAVAAGILRNTHGIALLSQLECFLYRKASHVSLISDGFRGNLLAKGVPAHKLSVIPAWADPDVVRPLPKDNPFRHRHHLDGHFVVMYAGNLGLTSALEDVLEAAALLRDHPAVRFVIVGEGVKKPSLLSSAQGRSLGNVVFLSFQPRDSFPTMLAAADVGLVTLNHSSSRTSLPSKIFNIMASGRPVIAVAPTESEIAAVVRDAECGLVVPPGSPPALVRSIVGLSADSKRAEQMGRNGRQHLEQHYSRRRCVDLYESTLARVIRS